MTRRDSGRKGGTVTLERYGRDQLAEWGKRGGRPKSQTYDDIRQRELRERNNNKEVKGFPGTSNLGTLKELYKARGRSSPIGETEPAGITQETPQEVVPARKDAT